MELTPVQIFIVDFYFLFLGLYVLIFNVNLLVLAKFGLFGACEVWVRLFFYSRFCQLRVVIDCVGIVFLGISHLDDT